MENGSRFDKYDRAIIALMQYRSMKKAAAALGINDATLWRWSMDPEFQRRLRYARYQVHSDSLASLREASKLAAETLVSILGNQNASPLLRVRIAQYILQHAERGFVLEDLKLEDFPLHPGDHPQTTADDSSGTDRLDRLMPLNLRILEEAQRKQNAAGQQQEKPIPGRSQIEAGSGPLGASDPPKEGQARVGSGSPVSSAPQSIKATESPAIADGTPRGVQRRDGSQGVLNEPSADGRVAAPGGGPVKVSPS